MNDIILGFLIYAELFRLAVIAAGIVTVIFGYKLFVRGVTGGKGGSNINAEVGEIKLTLANAGPGFVFALFGAFIITVMLVQGNPQLDLKDIKLLMKDGQQAEIGSASLKGRNYEESSEGLQHFDQAYNEGVEKQRTGNTEAAITAYNKALSESDVSLSKAAVVFNELAWSYRTQHRIDEALALAHIATTVAPDNANAFDTMALILLDRKEYKAAEKAAEKAINLDRTKQDYKNTLQQVRAAAQEAGQ